MNAPPAPDNPYTDRTILVVEDDETLREALVMEFELQGCSTVLSAESGNRAFAMVRSGARIDAVVSDIRMADGDGIGLLKRIKDDDPFAPLVLLVTGYADLSLVEALDLGAESVLKKPFDLDVLDREVRRALKPKAIRWREHAGSRPPATRITRAFGSMAEASAGSELRLGRGGVFIAMRDGFPTSNTRIGLELSFAQGPISRIDGVGTVKWTRREAATDLPTGVGIDFENLGAVEAGWIDEWVARMKLKPYIPRA